MSINHFLTHFLTGNLISFGSLKRVLRVSSYLAVFVCGALVTAPYAYSQRIVQSLDGSESESERIPTDDLLTLYSAALENDIYLKIDRHSVAGERAAGKLAKSAARGSLALSSRTTDNTTTLTNPPMVPVGQDSPPSSLDVAEEVTSASFSFPLFDLEAWNNSSAGTATIKASEHNWAGRQQDFIIRLTSAYLDTLNLGERLRAAVANYGLAEKQYKLVSERYRVGLATRADLQEAKAGRDLAEAGRIQAETALSSQRLQLALLIGRNPLNLAKLKVDYPIAAEKLNADMLVAKALANNPDLMTMQKRATAARRTAKASHYARAPKLTLSAQISETESDVPPAIASGTFGLDTSSETVVATLSWPLYTGGAISAKANLDSSQAEIAEQQLMLTKRNLETQVQTILRQIEGSITEVMALDQAIQSSQLALDATQTGYEAGTRNAVDLVRSAESYYQAVANYESARYRVISLRFNLEALLGDLNYEDVANLNEWLEEVAP